MPNLSDPVGPARPEWFDRVQVGDVLVTPSGDFRLVRAVHRRDRPYRGRGGARLAVFFAIRRCSWTRRPYTLYFDTDTYLRSMTWLGRAARWRLSNTDRAIVRELEAKGGERCGVTCEMVRGLP